MASDNKKIFTAVEKASIILSTLSNENISRIFSYMTSQEVSLLVQKIYQMGLVTNESKNLVLKEIISQFLSSDTESSAIKDPKNVQMWLKNVLDPKKFDIVIENIKEADNKNIWKILSNLDDRILALYLKNEHPQTIVLIFSKILPKQASRVIEHFSKELAIDVIERFQSLETIKPEILYELEASLDQIFVKSKMFMHNLKAIKNEDNFQFLAEIFNNFNRHYESKFMDILQKKNPEIANKIKGKMFTFNDLIKFSPKDIQKLLAKIERNELILALKGINQELVNFLFSNMSRRVANIAKEELKSLGVVRVKDVDHARSKILTQVKTMITKGEMQPLPKDEEEDEVIL